MAVKTNQELKRKKKAEKRAKVEKITNWFMINLAWGVFAILLMRYMENMIIVPGNMLVPAIIFGVLAVASLALGFTKFVKNRSRAINYTILSAVAAVVCLYFNYYHLVRNAVLGVVPSLSQLLPTSQWWTTSIVSLAIVIYLVGAFIYTAVKVALIEKKN